VIYCFNLPTAGGKPHRKTLGYIKEQLKWLRFEQIEELRAAVQKELNKLMNEVIASLTGWQFILEAILAILNHYQDYDTIICNT
jgi:hypothetical protein